MNKRQTRKRMSRYFKARRLQLARGYGAALTPRQQKFLDRILPPYTEKQLRKKPKRLFLTNVLFAEGSPYRCTVPTEIKVPFGKGLHENIVQLDYAEMERRILLLERQGKAVRIDDEIIMTEDV